MAKPERVKEPKRKPGRPPSKGPKKEPIFTTLLPDVVRRLDAEASRQTVSRAALISDLVERGLTDLEKSR